MMDKVGLADLIYLLLLSIPLLYLPRFLQHEIQAILLLITHQPEISLALFSLLFLPGVLLHETSHFLMARLLGVKTGRFSLIPKKIGTGHLQLGYVETESTDFFRDALIGAAPLFAGCIFIALAGVYRLEINVLWVSIASGKGYSLGNVFTSLANQPDFWLWFYLIFTVSSTMMPSASDRRAWLPLLLVILIFIGLILFLGAGPWLLAHFGLFIQSAVDSIMIVFGITVIIHLILLPPTWITRKIISRVSGYQVVS
jgi:hypothetical protein